MAAYEDDGLSTDELRQRLFQTFKDKGLLDLLKVQLRNHLIQELKHPPLAGQEPVPKLIPARSEPYLVSTCNSIVADHLRFSGYEYTLSVFYPESGLCKNMDVGTKEFMHLLRINPGSTLHSLLSSNEEDSNKGFLINLATHLSQHEVHSLRQDGCTQTTSSYAESLVEKMKMIDKEYDNFMIKGKVSSFDSQMAEYRREAKAQMEAELTTKMAHFKDVEIAKVRMEEKSTFNKEFEKLKQDLEKTYELKAKALLDREKNAIERLQKQQEIEEKNIYTQRQSVLKEIETVRNRETELKIRIEAFEKTCQIYENKVKTTEELLRQRELSVKTMEDTHDQRLKTELSRYQLELKQDFMERTESLKESETQNKVESARIQKLAAEIDAKSEEHSRVCSELKRLQAELNAGQLQISLLTQEKVLLKERLETMSDYSVLKMEKAELQAQLQLLRKQLEESQEENQQRRAELAMPSKELLVLQMEIQRLQNARKLDEEEFDNQKRVLQTQLQSEVERRAELKAQVTEYEDKMEWMANQAEHMKIQIQQTQKALENEVLCNPKPSLVDRSVLDLTADKLVPPDIYVDRALLGARVDHDDIFKAGIHCPELKSPRSDSGMKLIVGVKERLQELQQEVRILGEAYGNYQQRAVHSTISSHALPPRAPSPQQTSVSHFPNTFRRTQDPHYVYPPQGSKPSISHRPLSPHAVPLPPLDSRGTRTTFPPAQPRVTSEESGQQERPLLTEYGLGPVPTPLTLREPPESSLFKHGPSSLPFTSDNIFHEETLGESGESPVLFRGMSPFRLLSPEVHFEALPCERSPPRSPQLWGAARDQSSPVMLQRVISSAESSPQMEKISLENLTGLLSEHSHIPELLLDTAVPLSEEAPGGPTAPHPRDLPEDPVHLQGQTEVPEISDEPDEAGFDAERWEHDRIEREEQRQREREEARDRELQELERLEKETLLQEAGQPAGGKGEESPVEERADEEQTKETVAEKGECISENPLEKYMKLVLEERGKQLVQDPGREYAAHTSPEVRSLSEEKDNSIVAYSHKDEEEDDFW